MSTWRPQRGRQAFNVLRGHLGPEHVSGVNEERILFWHRGLATTDLAVARLFLGRAAEAGLGTVLRYR